MLAWYRRFRASSLGVQPAVNVLVQNKSADYTKVDLIHDPKAWDLLPDDPIISINCQGVIFEGFKGYTLEALGLDTGAIILTCWNDKIAMRWTFHPLQPDSSLGEAINTRQIVEELKDFTPPITYKPGAVLTDAQLDQYKAVKVEQGWDKFTEHLDPVELQADGVTLKDQRSQGRYAKAKGTRTYELSGENRANGDVVATNEDKLTTQPTAQVGEARTLAALTPELVWSFITQSTIEPAMVNWPNGTYRCQLNVQAAGANMQYGLLMVGTILNNVIGKFSRNTGGGAATVAGSQEEAQFTGTGLKLATKNSPATWFPGNGSQGDQFACVVGVYNSHPLNAQSITLNLGQQFSTFADGPWPSRVAVMPLALQGVGY